MTARRTIHLCQRDLPPPLKCLACGEVAESAARPRMPARHPVICYNRTDWESIYKDHKDYRRCVDAPDARDAPPKSYPTPTRPGYYWAEWRIVEPGTLDPNPGDKADEDKPVDAIGHPRIVEVRLSFDDDDTLVADVTGYEKAQPLDNFVWRSARLEEPK